MVHGEGAEHPQGPVERKRIPDCFTPKKDLDKDIDGVPLALTKEEIELVLWLTAAAVEGYICLISVISKEDGKRRVLLCTYGETADGRERLIQPIAEMLPLDDGKCLAERYVNPMSEPLPVEEALRRVEEDDDE